MTKSIRPVKVNHLNFVLEKYDESIEHFKKMFDAEFLADFSKPEFSAGLVEIGRVIFEPFVPREFLLNSRYGPHYLGIEYQADLGEVREVIASRGIRIIRDIDIALHTHPADCFGIAFEFYEGEFHTRDWPDLGGSKMKPENYWAKEHPLGLTGLKAYTVAVNDIDAASTFFEDFLSAERRYEEDRPEAAARAIGLQVADSLVELLMPSANGLIRNHLHQHGEGIRSTVFGVKDIDAARLYFDDRNIPLIAEAAPNSIAISPEANLGILFEFSQ